MFWWATWSVLESTFALTKISVKKMFVQEIQHLNVYVFPAVPFKPLLMLSSMCDLVLGSFSLRAFVPQSLGGYLSGI